MIAVLAAMAPGDTIDSVTARATEIISEPDVTTRAHGTDERVSVEGFLGAVRYFVRLIENLEEGLAR